MRHLATAIFLIFSAPANANAIIMECGSMLFKYQQTTFATKIEMRQDGLWHAFCSNKSDTLVVGDKGAQCKVEGGVHHEVHLFGSMKPVISVEQTIILDFIRMEHVRRTYSEIDRTNCKLIK